MFSFEAIFQSVIFGVISGITTVLLLKIFENKLTGRREAEIFQEEIRVEGRPETPREHGQTFWWKGESKNLLVVFVLRYYCTPFLTDLLIQTSIKRKENSCNWYISKNVSKHASQSFEKLERKGETMTGWPTAPWKMRETENYYRFTSQNGGKVGSREHTVNHRLVQSKTSLSRGCISRWIT